MWATKGQHSYIDQNYFLMKNLIESYKKTCMTFWYNTYFFRIRTRSFRKLKIQVYWKNNFEREKFRSTLITNPSKSSKNLKIPFLHWILLVMNLYLVWVPSRLNSYPYRRNSRSRTPPDQRGGLSMPRSPVTISKKLCDDCFWGDDCRPVFCKYIE